jgi:hypothetical protein
MMQMPAMDETLMQEVTVSLTLMGAKVPVNIRVFSTYLTTLDFSLYGSMHTFSIDKWRSGKFTRFFELFHGFAPRDADMYGSMATNEEGMHVFNANVDQKVNAVMYAAKDVVICLDKIGQHYKSSVLDYATWYREAHKEDSTYSEFITRLTCHLIVHTSFLSPNIDWVVIQFA